VIQDQILNCYLRLKDIMDNGKSYLELIQISNKLDSNIEQINSLITMDIHLKLKSFVQKFICIWVVKEVINLSNLLLKRIKNSFN
jgi:hypothetical protein